MWINFITHKKFSWKWIPWFYRSQVIYGKDGKTWLAPYFEFGWGSLLIRLTAYSREKEYKGKYIGHECPAELMQHRINELENAIRLHRDEIIDSMSLSVDRKLWEVLK